VGFVGAVLHLFNLFVPALAMGITTALLAKWFFRRELEGVRWTRLAFWSGGAAAAATLGGLLVTGRDGRMATYAAMVIASALALLWAGFGARGR